MGISDAQTYLPPQHDWITGDLIKDVAWLKWFQNMGNLHKQIKFVNVVGSLDDIADGTTYGKVAATVIDANGIVILAQTSGDLDDIDDGTTYSRVLTTNISAGQIVLENSVGADRLFTTSAKRTTIEAGLIDVIGAANSNMLLNPGFEETDGTDAYCWTKGANFLTSTNGIAAGSDSNNYYRINRSVINLYGYNLVADGSALRYFEVKEGEVYEFGGDARSLDGGQTALIGLVKYDEDKSSGHTLGTELTTSVTDFTSLGPNRVTIPSGTKFITFRCGSAGGDGYALFDNCYLRKVDTLAWSWAASSDRTKIEGGNIYTGTITLSAINGASGNLSITSSGYIAIGAASGLLISSGGGIVVQSGGGLTVNSGGGISLDAGGDLNLSPSDTDPSKIIFKDSGAGTYHAEMFRAATNDILGIYPVTDNTCYFRIGDGSSRFLNIAIYSEDFLYQSAAYNGDNYSYIRLDSGNVTGNFITQYIENNDVINQLRFDNGKFYPLQGTINLGDSGYGFHAVYLTPLSSAPSNPTDGMLVAAASAWSGLGYTSLATYHSSHWYYLNMTLFD